jgi:hypothetical protein
MRDFADIPQAPLRPASEVMRLARMGAMFPTRLSFLRVLMRALHAENVKVTRSVWKICPDGFGHAVYSLDLGGYTYSLIAVSTDLPAEQRTDRVIATAWDTAYVLYDGVPDSAELERIRDAAPKQEAARFCERDLVLSRANKSVRLFDHVVQSLRAGQQPDEKMVREVGYLMRTTAVYGNGKFGIADRGVIDTRPVMGGPFMAEMLTVWLIRHFTHDLAEHVGRAKLDPRLKRHLGIGNATGLGMAPFLVNHPVLLNNWMLARETALARVRAVQTLSAHQAGRIAELYLRSARHLKEWQVPDAAHQRRVEDLSADWAGAAALFKTASLRQPAALENALEWSLSQSVDLQELMVALLLEPFGDLIDGLADCMSDPFGTPPCALQNTGELRAALALHFHWALDPDYDQSENCAQFWYVSAAKQEPRLGLRFEEPGADLESPLDIGRRIRNLSDDLPKESVPLAVFLANHPDHALAVSRVGLADRYPYAEIRDNLIGRTCLPIDMLRCKLAFFGAAKFDPKSDRWTRITLCQGAPLADEIAGQADDWWLPVFGT